MGAGQWLEDGQWEAKHWCCGRDVSIFLPRETESDQGERTAHSGAPFHHWPWAAAASARAAGTDSRPFMVSTTGSVAQRYQSTSESPGQSSSGREEEKKEGTVVSTRDKPKSRPSSVRNRKKSPQRQQHPQHFIPTQRNGSAFPASKLRAEHMYQILVQALATEGE